MNDIPISILTHNFRRELSDLVNKSGLPYCVLESIMCAAYSDVKAMADNELRDDIASYKEAHKDA